MRHIIYIINPIAGPRTKKDLQQFIEKKTKEAGIPYLVFPSVASGDYAFLSQFIKDHKTTDIVIAGGDGTVSQAVHALLKHNLRFGIIPCGSGNGLALTAGIPKQPSKALELIFKGPSSLTDGFYVNDDFACMLVGLGFDAKVAHDFANQPTRGLSTYIRQVFRNFFSAAPYTFEIITGSKRLQVNAFFISIANSNQFGNNFTIAPQASLQDGLLDIVIVTEQTKLSLIVQTIRQVRGLNKLQTIASIEKKKGVIYFQASDLQIRNLSEAPLHIDGDPVETKKKLDIHVRKHCFQLIRPNS